MERTRRGFLVEGKGDVYKPLHMIFGEGLVVEALENQSKDTKDANQKLCDKERASGFRALIGGLSKVKSLSNLSFQKIIS